MLAHSVLIEPSKLLVTRTDIKALMSLILGQIRLLTLELYILLLSDENFTHLNLNVSEVNLPIMIKFYV